MRYILTILILILLLGGFFLYRGISSPSDPDSEEIITFEVKKGEGAKEISQKLKEEGLIRYSSFFRIYVLLKGVQGELKAGRYELSPSMNIPAIVDKIYEGSVIKEEITIIEGWNLRDIGWFFENEGRFTAEEVFEVAGFPAADYQTAEDLPRPEDFSREFSFLEDKPERVGLEGFLFPDTYEISREEGVKDIIYKMLQNFDKKLASNLREEINSQGKTVFEIITIASLIEKEVRELEDKKIVSGILWKRLEKGIPLQVDATITYITGKKSTEIFKEEMEIDSPFNTYKYKGLPLGPICNPGLESIESAVYPQESPYLYYLSTPEGETVFSKTFEEHKKAKREYLK